MSSSPQIYKVILTDTDLKTCMVGVEVNKNARSGQYALFEVELTSFPRQPSGPETPLLRSQLQTHKLSTMTIPEDAGDIRKWLYALFRNAFGKDCHIMVY